VAFFATGDSIVANNLVLNLYKNINSPEARMFLGRQLYEECFAAGTEILTDRGWVKFEVLGDEKVAQFNTDTSEVSFVVPTRKIKRHHTGKLVEFQGQRFHQKVTPNHQMVFKRYGDKSYRKVDAELLGACRSNIIPVAGVKSSGRSSITAADKFRIALQADGHILTVNPNTGGQYNGKISGCRAVVFNFKKERKIKRMQELLEILGWESSSWMDNVGQTHIYVKVPLDTYISKGFEWVKLEAVSASWCLEFLEELTHWDGSRSGNTFRYCSTNESCIDVVQSLGALCGVRVSRNYQTLPSGKKHYQAVFDYRGTVSADVKKTLVDYDDDVYCVTVPTGAIIIRSNGHVSVSGNC
jgi:hypothetical protein